MEALKDQGLRAFSSACEPGCHPRTLIAKLLAKRLILILGSTPSGRERPGGHTQASLRQPITSRSPLYFLASPAGESLAQADDDSWSPPRSISSLAYAVQCTNSLRSKPHPLAVTEKSAGSVDTHSRNCRPGRGKPLPPQDFAQILGPEATRRLRIEIKDQVFHQIRMESAAVMAVDSSKVGFIRVHVAERGQDPLVHLILIQRGRLVAPRMVGISFAVFGRVTRRSTRQSRSTRSCPRSLLDLSRLLSMST